MTLETGSGFWTPVIFIVFLIIAALIALIIRRFGEKDYKKGTEQTKPFLCGNAEKDKDAMHVRSGNIYWGFLEALKGYYKPAVRAHTGILSDYMIWYIGTMVLILIVVFLGGIL